MSQPHVAIFCKTGKSKGRGPYNAGGLAANALHTVAVLRSWGVSADMFLVDGWPDVVQALAKNPTITVAIIEAVWVKVADLVALAQAHPDVQILVRAHSKIGFLQVEPEAIPVMMSIISHGQTQKNLSLCSNNQEFAQSLAEAYGPCAYLPNLYDVTSAPARQRHPATEPLRVASFGATRLLKLHPNAALAAIQVAKRMGRNLDFYVNTDATPGAESVRNAVRNLCYGQTDIVVRLFQVPWQDADTFRETIASMDLVLQLSATETFCLVAADAVASGVPTVVSPAIDWLPQRYQANADLTSRVADVAVAALRKESRTTRQELAALNNYLKAAKAVWLKFLGVKTSFWSR